MSDRADANQMAFSVTTSSDDLGKRNNVKLTAFAHTYVARGSGLDTCYSSVQRRKLNIDDAIEEPLSDRSGPINADGRQLMINSCEQTTDA